MISVLVSVGTHEQPFYRLLDMVRAVIPGVDTCRWVVQHGPARWVDVPGVPAKPYFDSHEMDEFLAASDLLVSQASPGNVYRALDHGVRPLVVGRRKKYEEHVDDHQVEFADRLFQIGLADSFESTAELDRLVRHYASSDMAGVAGRCRTYAGESRQREHDFRRNVWAHIAAGEQS